MKLIKGVKILMIGSSSQHKVDVEDNESLSTLKPLLCFFPIKTMTKVNPKHNDKFKVEM